MFLISYFIYLLEPEKFVINCVKLMLVHSLHQSKKIFNYDLYVNFCLKLKD